MSSLSSLLLICHEWTLGDALCEMSVMNGISCMYN